MLAQAQAVAPQAARPLVQRAQQLARMGELNAAMAAWAELGQRDPSSFVRLAGEYVDCALAAGRIDAATQTLAPLFALQPGIDLLRALAKLDSGGTMPRLMDLLREQPSLSAAIELLDTPRQTWPESARQSARDAVARAARPLQRYRCAACGFEAQRHFWQCPGCLGWDSFPQQRIEEL
jgi:lipopolysaccharide biosynthesis regulator YciM